MKKRFDEKRLDEKLRIIFTTLMAVLLTVILSLFLVTSYTSTRQQVENLARSQVTASERLYRSWFAEVEHTALSVILDASVQQFCDSASAQTDYDLRDQVKNTLSNAINMNDDLLFFAVINDDDGEDFVSRGEFSVQNAAFKSTYREVLEQARRVKERGALSFFYVDEFSQRDEAGFVMLHPVFSTEKIFKRTGTLLIYLSGRLFTDSAPSGQSLVQNTMLTAMDGRVIVSSSPLADGFAAIDYAGQEEGVVRYGMNDYYFKRIEDTYFYVLCQIAHMELMRPVLHSALLMVMLAVVLLAVSILVTRRIIARNYKPLEIVVGAMKHVQNGDVDYRVRTDDAGEDFRALENGYNDMMDTINDLFARIREEQHQAEQIKFNALQSQIQPHFLYNTLECIHWQARADGDTKTSELVQELANYYRICLSKGKEIIPLAQELEHMCLYLSIQKKRYGNIITYSVDVPEKLKNILIPKLTLQPLVENSIYHGIRVKEGLQGEIRVSAYETEEGVYIEESDNGLGMTDADIDAMNASISDYSRDFGYGVRNVNRRIELYFGASYGLKYSRNASGGITTTIHLPKTFMESSADAVRKDAHV